MGRLLPLPEELALSSQIRALGDEELLDFWEESQYLAPFLEDENVNEGGTPPDYERLILQELQLRSCRRHAERRP